MNEKDPMQLALFRFGLISPLLPLTEEGKLKEKIQEQADRIWTLPDGRLRKFGFSTIEAWYYAYKRGGLDVLKDKQRHDKGTYRAINEPLISEIEVILNQHPKLSSANIIELLVEKKIVVDSFPSDTTLYRYIRSQRPPKTQQTCGKERRAFEAPHAGSLWQTDIMYGPHVTFRTKAHRYQQKQTYLVAIIDDHSRLCCHAEFYLEQTLASVIDTFKKACQKRGVPERFYCDHGQVFISSQLSRIGAVIGSVILHPQVRDAAAKGKIERFFKTVRDSFLNKLMNLDPPKTLELLNQKFASWIETSYNNKHHSGIGQSPMQKWLLSAHNIRLLPLNDDSELLFMLEVKRKVKKDGTFSLHASIFETQCSLVGKQILVRYNPFDITRVHVYFDTEYFGVATFLDKQHNSKRPRNNPN